MPNRVNRANGVPLVALPFKNSFPLKRSTPQSEALLPRSSQYAGALLWAVGKHMQALSPLNPKP